MGREREGEFDKEEKERQEKTLSKTLTHIKGFRPLSSHFAFSFPKLWERIRPREREREKKKILRERDNGRARRGRRSKGKELRSPSFTKVKKIK